MKLPINRFTITELPTTLPVMVTIRVAHLVPTNFLANRETCPALAMSPLAPATFPVAVQALATFLLPVDIGLEPMEECQRRVHHYQHRPVRIAGDSTIGLPVSQFIATGLLITIGLPITVGLPKIITQPTQETTDVNFHVWVHQTTRIILNGVAIDSQDIEHQRSQYCQKSSLTSIVPLLQNVLPHHDGAMAIHLGSDAATHVLLPQSNKHRDAHRAPLAHALAGKHTRNLLIFIPSLPPRSYNLLHAVPSKF